MGVLLFVAAVVAHAPQPASLPVTAPHSQLAASDSKPMGSHRHGVLAVPAVTPPRMAAAPARLPRSRGTDLIAP